MILIRYINLLTDDPALVTGISLNIIQSSCTGAWRDQTPILGFSGYKLPVMQSARIEEKGYAKTHLKGH